MNAGHEQSFMKSLFFGVIAESLIFPYPEPPAPRTATRCACSSTSVRRFFAAERRLRRRSTASSAIPAEVLGGLKELGLFGMLDPAEYGGVGLTQHRLRPRHAGGRRASTTRAWR